MKKPSRLLISVAFGVATIGLALFAYRYDKAASPVAHQTLTTPASVVLPEATPPTVLVAAHPELPLPLSNRLSLGDHLVSLRLDTRRSSLRFKQQNFRPMITPAKRSAESESEILRTSKALTTKLESTNTALLPPLQTPLPANVSVGTASPEGKPIENKRLPAEITYAFGVGLDLLPRWMGSSKTEIRPIPYIDVNWRDQIELSTVKGLVIDVLHGEYWHGGLIGTMVWGRSTRDLAGLNVPTRQNTIQGGLYLEYAPTPEVSVGVRLRQDIQNTGVSYGEIYTELELPKVGYLQHDIRLSLEGMNSTGMRRFFGLSTQDAARLGVSAYQPRAGLSKLTFTYEGFLPTSESTGFAFALNFGRLTPKAADSPLVSDYGSSFQKEIMTAFIYHF